VAKNIKPHPNFSEIYWIHLDDGTRNLGTKNFVPGCKVYGERLIKFNGEEYRIWDPYRSKLAAAILKGLSYLPIQPSQSVLYLGAASGTTASHVSDILGEKGHVFCVEFAPRSFRDLVNNVCTFRYNMSPILGDVRIPKSYSKMVMRVDNIYFDVAQPEQARFLADNADMFLVEDGWILLAIKAQSIDVTKEPSKIYEEETKVLVNRGFLVKEIVNLEPFDKAHVMVIAQKFFK
jgi:fibrillarin-like pre-rRNA processing protein